MNPLTLVKRIQSLNSKEAALGISEDASWHAKYRDSAYVFAGGIPYDLTEGDLLAVFAQYGEIVDVNLVRDKGTGKPKGFAFIAYEDQRSTNLAVDNLNGAQVLGRIIRVDHVSKYKKKEEEDEETEQKKREERGMCRAFQRGECSRGAGCKFSHDEQRAANTGWGPKDDRSARWGHDKFEVPRTKGNEGLESNHKCSQSSSRDQDVRFRDKRPEFREREVNYEEDGGKQSNARSSRKHDYEIQSTEALDRREEKRSKRQDSEYNHRGDRDLDVYRRGDPKYKGGEKKLVHGSDSSVRHHRGAVDYRDSEFYWSEDQRNQGGEKRSMYERDSSSHQRRGTDEGRDRQFYPWGDRNNHGGKKRSVHERDSTSHHHGETDEDY